jgi:hypothetical protein
MDRQVINFFMSRFLQQLWYPSAGLFPPDALEKKAKAHLKKSFIVQNGFCTHAEMSVIMASYPIHLPQS